MYHIHHLTHQKTCILCIEQQTIEHTINHITNSARKNKHSAIDTCLTRVIIILIHSQFTAGDRVLCFEEELALYEEYNKSISTDRNAGMLEVAKEYLESGETVFYAVGLAHLLQENGLVDTLRDAGFTVEQVAYT